MWRYLTIRLRDYFLVLIVLFILVGVLIRLIPGDPAEMIVMLGYWDPSKEAVQRLREQLGLHLPVYQQLIQYAWRALHGDLGRSLSYNISVSHEIRTALPFTIQLTVSAMIVCVMIGIPCGIVAAARRGSWLDTILMSGASIGLAVPSFWLGLILIYVFSVKLRWFPPAGTGGIRKLVLPALSLGVLYGSNLARITRSCMLEVLGEAYIITARGKGLIERIVLIRHALLNALIPVVTVMGLQVGHMLAGSVVVEIVFGRMGMGRVIVRAILDRDYPVVQGTLFIMASGYLLVNILVDISYSFLDPRIRRESVS
jgi:peptide/nickel transport system permease protein